MATSENYDANKVINGTGAADSIVNNRGGNNVSINAGAGDDSIWTSGHNVTVSGGTGNDYLWRENGAGIAYVYSGGNDTISGFDVTNSTLVIADSYTTLKNDSTVTITVAGKGTITLVNYFFADNVNIVSSISDVTHYNLNDNIEHDKIFNGTNGDDYIFNGDNNVSMSAGAGNDYIDNQGSDVIIYAGAGNDSVTNWGVNVSISGGGNDYIDFGAFDTPVVEGAEYTAVTSGYDVLVQVGDNTITLGGAASLSKVNIATSTANIVPVNIVDTDDDNATIKGTSASNVISNYGFNNVKISGGANADSIYSYGSDNTVNAGKGNDYIYMSNGVLVYANGDGNDTIDIDGGLSGNEVTVSLTSGTLGATTLSDDGSIFLKVGSGSLTFAGNAQANKILIKDSTGKTTAISAGRTALENSANNTIISATAGNYYIANSGSSVKVNTGNGTDGIYNTGSNVTINAGAGNDQIRDRGENISINGGDGDDYVYFGGFLGDASNVTINAGKGNDTITNGASNCLIQYASGDGNDTVYYFGEDSTLQIGDGTGTYSTVKSGDDVIVNVGEGRITLWRAVDLDTLNIVGTQAKTLTLTNASSAKVTLPASYASANASARTTASIAITGNTRDNSIVGGAKADTLNGLAGNDTLTGGYGADTFVYTGGKDVITDYGANFDKVSLAGDGAKYLSHITGVKTSGSDVTLTFSKDNNKTLTLLNAANKKVIVNGAIRIFGNNSISTGDKRYATLTSGFGGTFNANGYKGVNASGSTQAVTISGANSIVGGAKADSLIGTTGNDTLTGGYGADTFVYTGGKDVTLTFSNDSNKTLTINGVAGKKVIINGVTRTFTASADVYWFDEDNFGDAQIDSITETAADYSVGKLDTADTLTKLTRDEFLLTFGGDK